MAVSKKKPRTIIEEAHLLGLRLFGENRVFEARDKFLPELSPDTELHLIGHLQRNKAGVAAEVFNCVQSIDKEATARSLAHELGERGRRVDVFLEVNTSGEPQKFGVSEYSRLQELAETVSEMTELRLRGLMTIAPFTDNEADLRAAFASLRRMRDQLETSNSEFHLPELSMGMSNDFELAVEEGSTMVRLGTAIFGERE